MECQKHHSIKELANRLKDLELKFGGVVTGVKRTNVSAQEPKNYNKIHQGNDKFTLHNYSVGYAEALHEMLGAPLTLIEIGVLAGHGLAVLSDVLPVNSSIHGLDIDPKIYEGNLSALKSKGAFGKNVPAVHRFDQYNPNVPLLKTIGRADIVVDDGAHLVQPIMKTLSAFKNANLLPKVYIIEDMPCRVMVPKIKHLLPKAKIRTYDDQLTVVYIN